MDEKSLHRLTVRMNKELYQKLTKYADKRGLTKNSAITLAIYELVNKEK